MKQSFYSLIGWLGLLVINSLLTGITLAEAPVTRNVKAFVTDRDDRPIEGATVVPMDWLRVDDDRDDVQKAVTNSKGEFEFEIDERTTNSDYVMIFKEGYAVGALNLSVLPARARLFRMKAVPLRIVDAQRRPVANARVTIGEVGFDDEFLQANVPAAIAQLSAAISRTDGWAILRCTRPEFAQSVNVEVDGYGIQSFAGKFSDDNFHVLQLWDTMSIQVQIMNGPTPAPKGWVVFATCSEFIEQIAGAEPSVAKNPITGDLLPKGILLTRKTDAEGRIGIEHALMGRPMNLMVFDSNQDLRGVGRIVSMEGQDGPYQLRVSPSEVDEGQPITGQVVETSSGKAIAGVEVTYTQRQGLLWREVHATSKENGELSARLTPGTWYVEVAHAPAGYCNVVTSENEIVLPETGEHSLPEIRIPKAEMIRGKIEGVDLAIRRARWIHVTWSAGADQTGEIRGRFQADGRFEIAIPHGSTAESFSIVAVGGGSDQLEIQSHDPLVLVGNPR